MNYAMTNITKCNDAKVKAKEIACEVKLKVYEKVY